LRLSNFAENWNPMHVDGNNYDYSRVREPMLPVFFDFDASGVPTPNPNYVLSVEVVSEVPTVIRYKLNPAAVWGDGSAVDGDDMVAKWQACNGRNTEFNCVSTENYEPIEIADDAKAQAFANAEIDAFDIASDPDAFQRALRVENADVRKAGGPNFRHFTFNSKAALLQDLTIRQAIVHALDRQDSRNSPPSRRLKMKPCRRKAC